MALKQRLNRQQLKDKIGDENIFNFYFGEFDIAKSYHSCFRKDDKKSTGFFINKSGSVVYNDFVTSDKYDFVAFVMKMYNLSYYHALERIAIDFGIIAGERSSEKPALIKHIVHNKPKPEKVIKVGVVKFKKYHLDYWLQYGITEEELKANYVYAVNNLYINSWQLPTAERQLRFAYLIKDENDKEYLKVYSPYDKDYKWTHSGPLNVPFGLNDLPLQSDTLFITKGQKDRIILKKYFTDVIALQNESPSALTKQAALALKKVYKTIYIWFDMDRPGIKAANYYKKVYGFIPLFTVNNNKTIWQNLTKVKADSIKDLSDFVARHGIETFKKYLKHIKLI